MSVQPRPPCKHCEQPATTAMLDKPKGESVTHFVCDVCFDDAHMPLCLTCAKLANLCECTGGPWTDPNYREDQER